MGIIISKFSAVSTCSSFICVTHLVKGAQFLNATLVSAAIDDDSWKVPACLFDVVFCPFMAQNHPFKAWHFWRGLLWIGCPSIFALSVPQHPIRSLVFQVGGTASLLPRPRDTEQDFLCRQKWHGGSIPTIIIQKRVPACHIEQGNFLLRYCKL